MVAGDGDAGFSDGAGDGGASFNAPNGLALDALGNLYVADTGNNAVRELDTAGNVTTLAGDGTAGFLDGQGSSTEFNAPQALAFDAAGNLYVTDLGNGAVRRIDASGKVTTLAGNGGQATLDGPGGCAGSAEFNHPRGIAVDLGGKVIVADDWRIRKITPEYSSATKEILRGAGRRRLSLFSDLGPALRISGGARPWPALCEQDVARLEAGRRPGTGATLGAQSGFIDSLAARARSPWDESSPCA